jgi:hypothetical protein
VRSEQRQPEHLILEIEDLERQLEQRLTVIDTQADELARYRDRYGPLRSDSPRV